MQILSSQDALRVQEFRQGYLNVFHYSRLYLSGKTCENQRVCGHLSGQRSELCDLAERSQSHNNHVVGQHRIYPRIQCNTTCKFARPPLMPLWEFWKQTYSQRGNAEAATTINRSLISTRTWHSKEENKGISRSLSQYQSKCGYQLFWH